MITTLSPLRVTSFFHDRYTIGPMPKPLDKLELEQLRKLGERVRTIREQKSFTLQQVGHAIGKDRQSIHRLEKGEFNPSYIYLLDICKGLEIDIVDLFKPDE